MKLHWMLGWAFSHPALALRGTKKQGLISLCNKLSQPQLRNVNTKKKYLVMRVEINYYAHLISQVTAYTQSFYVFFVVTISHTIWRLMKRVLKFICSILCGFWCESGVAEAARLDTRRLNALCCQTRTKKRQSGNYMRHCYQRRM